MSLAVDLAGWCWFRDDRMVGILVGGSSWVGLAFDGNLIIMKWNLLLTTQSLRDAIEKKPRLVLECIVPLSLSRQVR